MMSGDILRASRPTALSTITMVTRPAWGTRSSDAGYGRTSLQTNTPAQKELDAYFSPQAPGPQWLGPEFVVTAAGPKLASQNLFSAGAPSLPH